MRRLLSALPWLLLAGLVLGSTASAVGHESALAGLTTTLAAMVDAFREYLGAL